MMESSGRFKIDCPICLQEYVNPAQLPCNHIFCYLCIKGAAFANNRCALCRQEIPDGFLENPFLLEKEDEIEIALYDNNYHWFYEGHEGWWLYDQRTSEDIEIAFKKGDETTELLIAGHLYIIDFKSMMQYRKNNARKRRKIKRDIRDNNFIKGVSGIPINGNNGTDNETDLSPTETVRPATPTAPEEFEDEDEVIIINSPNAPSSINNNVNNFLRNNQIFSNRFHQNYPQVVNDVNQRVSTTETCTSTTNTIPSNVNCANNVASNSYLHNSQREANRSVNPSDLESRLTNLTIRNLYPETLL